MNREGKSRLYFYLICKLNEDNKVYDSRGEYYMSAMGRAFILGTGSYIPEKVVTNDDLSKVLDMSGFIAGQVSGNGIWRPVRKGRPIWQ